MEVLGEIARGGFGRVERVMIATGEVVARKVFDPRPELDVLDPDKLRKRFVHEVEAQRRLAPYGAIRVLDADLAADAPWFTMPLAEKSYRVQIEADRRAGAISSEPLVAILDALENIHRLGYVHRDLKPENVLFCEGAWRLADFGLVAVPHGAESTRLTSTGAGWATAGYCAPEQAIDFKNADKSVDIYAFGCILHDLAGNRPRVPFQMHVAKGPIGPVISRCTHLDPHQRFKGVGPLRAALLDALGRAAQPLEPSAEAEAWGASLARIHEWDEGKLEELIAYAEEHSEVCASLDDERLHELHGVDPIAWRRVALAYGSYAQGRFRFERCDGIATALQTLFELGDVEVKAASLFALATLGLRHNRWFALKKLVALAGPALDVDVAERLALDIRAYERQDVFVGCAAAMAKPVTVFHPRVAAVLDGTHADQSTSREGHKPAGP
ncbi:MAG TPA: protein kinase [Polyangiaceae bacterium]|jgi:hypothetical protein